MDYDNILNLERRTGVKNEDIDDFNRKADAVSAAIRGMLDGTVDPSKVKIEGIETEEEKEAKEAARQKRLAELKIRDEEKRIKRKNDEKELWWGGAEFYMENKRENNISTNSTTNTQSIAKLDYHKLNYSKWDSWEPTDEVSLKEKHDLEQQEEDRKNREFEANNKQFCDEIIENNKKREKDAKQKVESAEISRKKGNDHFKHKRFEQALEYYVSSLKLCPYDTNTLSNIAQVHIRLNATEDALEFLSRVLYIDEKHIKALYRKAELHHKLGEHSTALSLLSRAQAVDSTNVEVNALFKDITQIVKELKDEGLYVEKDSNTIATNTTDAVGGGSSAESKAEGGSAVDSLTTVFNAVTNVKAVSDTNIITADSITADITTLNTLLHTSAIANADKSNNTVDNVKTIVELLQKLSQYATTKPLLKTQIRTSEVLLNLFQYLRILFSTLNISTVTKACDYTLFQTENVAITRYVADIIQYVTVFITEQRSSQQQLLESKLIALFKGILSICCLSHNDIPINTVKLHISHNIVTLFQTCMCNDICPKLQQILILDTEIYQIISIMIENLSQYVHFTAYVNDTNYLSILSVCGNILKFVSFSDHAKVVFQPILGHIVCSIGSCLHTLYNARQNKVIKSKDINNIIFDVLDLYVDVSVGLSQLEVLRSFFIIQCSSTDQHNDNNANSTADVLIKMILNDAESTSNCLAVLMNICTGGVDMTIKQAVVTNLVFITHLLNTMQMTIVQRQKEEQVILVRKAGLLSRIASVSIVQTQLKQPTYFRALCLRLQLKDQNTTDKLLLDERAHYVRILASLTGLDSVCKQIARDEKVIESLLCIFPVPRNDLGVITAQSVTLIPSFVQSPALLGNTAKCLISFADDTECAKTLFLSTHLMGIEKLICALATCTDMSVRRNIAIILAKGCGLGDKVRSRVTELRGLEIMRNLGM